MVSVEDIREGDLVRFEANDGDTVIQGRAEKSNGRFVLRGIGYSISGLEDMSYELVSVEREKMRSGIYIDDCGDYWHVPSTGAEPILFRVATPSFLWSESDYGPLTLLVPEVK